MASKITTFLFFLIATCNGFSKTFYVSPSGTPSGDGNSFATAVNFKSALAQVNAGDSILLQGGTYVIPFTAGIKNTIVFSKSGKQGKPIYVVTNNNATAVFDFSYPEYEWIQDGFGFDVSGSYWYFKGISITRAGYQGAYVKGSNNTFINCSFSFCKFSGLEINKGGSYTTVINCDSYKNYNVKVISGKTGGAADGFAPKQTQGAGNVLIGCRAWENSDDGFDTFDSPEAVVMENCWAFNNGYLQVGNLVYSGNMDGFKLGGNNKVQNNKVYNCLAFGNGFRGFDENNNKGGVTLYNCLAYDNNVNYAFGGTLNSGQKHDFKNNISLKEEGTSTIRSGSIQANNTWNNGFSVTTSDFKSLDMSLAYAPRQTDGSLPETDLFRLTEGSRLVDAGASTGRPFNGLAPDIGPFETSVVTSAVNRNFKNDVLVYPTLAEEEVNVRLLSDMQDVYFTIYSMDGEEKLSGNLVSGQNTVPCGSFASGKYLIRIVSNVMEMSFLFMKL